MIWIDLGTWGLIYLFHRFQYGWYWGPISGDAAEKLLNGEPDGSFLVRDSSDDHYIFSLTFKLNGNVRHVRIEHDQGKVILLLYKPLNVREVDLQYSNLIFSSR